MNGSVAHADAFGIRCVLDDDLPSSNQIVVNCRQAGRRVLHEWRTVSETYPDAFRDLHVLPPWCWALATRDLLARVSLLSAFLARQVADARFADVEALLDADSWLAAEILQTARAALAAGPIGECSSRFLLAQGRACDDGVAHAGRRVRSQMAGRRAARSRYAAGADAIVDRIDPRFHVELWRRVLGAAPRPERIPLLAAAVTQLGAAECGALVSVAVPQQPTRQEYSSFPR